MFYMMDIDGDHAVRYAHQGMNDALSLIIDSDVELKRDLLLSSGR